MTILDIARFGRWHPWSADDEGSEIEAELKFCDSETASSLAAEDASFLADADHSTVAERAIRLRAQGRLRASEAGKLIFVMFVPPVVSLAPVRVSSCIR